MIKYSLGIDFSMKLFHACLSVIDMQQQVKVKALRKFTNNQRGFIELYEWLQKHYKDQDIPLHIVMEATGVYYEQCAMYLLSLIHISEPTRQAEISYAVFCLKK